MDIKVTQPRLSHEYGNGWVLSVLVDMDSTASAKQVVDEMLDKTIRLSVREWKEQRSLTANAYFHVLINKIAEKMRISADEVKSRMVLDYGTMARDKDGDAVCLNLPKDVDPEKLGIVYAKWVCDTDNISTYLVYAPTHTLDSKEFSRLLDGTIHEAKTIGIETLPPAELERMMASYEKTHKGTCDPSAS